MKITDLSQFPEDVGLHVMAKSLLTFSEWKDMDDSLRGKYMYEVRSALFNGNSMFCTKNKAWWGLHENDNFECRIGSLDRYGRKDDISSDKHDAAIIEETIRYITGIDVSVAYWGWKGNTQVVRMKFHGGFTVLVFAGDYGIFEHIGVIIDSTNTFLIYMTSIAYAVTYGGYAESCINAKDFRVFLYDDKSAHHMYITQMPLYEYEIKNKHFSPKFPLYALLYGNGDEDYDDRWFDCVLNITCAIVSMPSCRSLLNAFENK
jgi:hypothetical protein